MGGTIFSLKARTEEELKMRVAEIIQRAAKKGLKDVRGVKLFAPGTYVKDNGKPENNWIAKLWIHS